MDSAGLNPGAQSGYAGQARGASFGHTLTSLLICGGAALAAAAALKSIGGGLLAEAAAIVCFAAHPTLQESLEQRELSFSSKLYTPWMAAITGLTRREPFHGGISPAGILHELQQYEPPWYVIVASAAVLFTLVDLVVGFALGFVFAIVGLASTGAGRVALILILLAINCFIAYRLGAWVGEVLHQRQFLLILGAVFSAQVMGQAINALAGIETPGLAVGAVILGTIIWSIPAFIGVWRGKRHHTGLAPATASASGPNVTMGLTPKAGADMPSTAAGGQADSDPPENAGPEAETIPAVVQAGQIQSENEPAAQKSRVCPSCGMAAIPRARFCLNCGSTLPEEPA